MTISLPVAAQVWGKGLTAAQAGDFATAIKEWKPLAEAGDFSAQFLLGSLYDEGKGVPQDFAEAVKWYRLAAKQGFVMAQYNLGIKYAKGQGVLQDYAESIKWSRLAAEQGDGGAQHNLGLMHKVDKGVLQDNVMSHMWYNIASANGNTKAGEWRDERAGLMTPEDISKAQAMARECMSSGYTKCGY